MPVGSAGADGLAPDGVSLAQEQLALRLQSERAPVTVIVVDHAETPTPD